MLSQSHFIAFEWHKIQTIFKWVETLTFTFSSCIHQIVAQKLVDNRIHVFYVRHLCRRPPSGVGVLKQRCYSVSIDRVCWCTLEAYKYEKCNHNGGRDDFCSLQYWPQKAYSRCCSSCTYSRDAFTNGFAGK